MTESQEGAGITSNIPQLELALLVIFDLTPIFESLYKV